MPTFNDFELDIQNTTASDIYELHIGKDSIKLSCIPSCGPVCSTTPVKTL